MKKSLKLFLCLLLSTIFFFGCSKESIEEKDQEIYIGDNAKVVDVASNLEYPKGVSYQSIEIQSSKEPYELKVFVEKDGEEPVNMDKCAEEAFEKIFNMGKISFYNKEDESLIESFNRE